ncbi:hypothetical protein AX17_002507 [Amanita inopinata Kibby_2008]|nr:hypothetical protein AX17_002507 [Amanita inopinata Kibby_2008]
MSRNTSLLVLLFVLFAFCLPQNGVYAFGAGNIPSFAYMEGKAFRHGDIEDVLADLIKRAGGGFALASLISKGSKFSGIDVKRVYFGNWLRDYSQAVDIAGLKKLQLQSIITVCMVLGFLAHGYATSEFEVTAERLGVYLPVEHIDNPKGYGDGEDARRYHPKLRGPVDPMELQIDQRTGMKNYIANEQGRWDTSKAHVRRVLQECIRLGRMHRSQGRKEDEYEAYRLLGTALHTLEDFPAHSNFCELVLVSMGHQEVFSHVGDRVRIQAPNGKWVAPIVTGTFGSSDFIHSLLGEATDHLSEASVSDLNRELDGARARSQGTRGGPGFDPADTLRSLLFTLPGGSGGDMSREMENIERIRAGPSQGGKRPEDMTPQELHATLWQVLVFRDSVVKNISNTIEKIPGLGSLLEKVTDSISVFVLTTIEPFIKPLLKTATSGLALASGEVINNHDQYEVFNDPRASDPTHSFLSKDHFNLILNEAAGQIARVIVSHTVNLVVKAWDDQSQNVHHVTEDILSCLFHPDFHDPNSKIQREMLQTMRTWVHQLGSRQRSVLSRLTKDAVRSHQNTRLSGEGGAPVSQDSFAASEAHNVQQELLGQVQNIPGVGQAASFLMKQDGLGYKKTAPEYSSSFETSSVSGVSETGAHYAGTRTEARYTPAHGGGAGGSYGSSYTTTQGHGQTYQPPPGPPPGHYGAPGETSHTGYAPSYMPPSGPPPEPGFPGFSGAEPHVRPPHGFRDLGGAGGMGGGGYAPPPGPPPFGFPDADQYGVPPSQGPPFPGAPPRRDDSYSYGWRG